MKAPTIAPDAAADACCVLGVAAVGEEDAERLAPMFKALVQQALATVPEERTCTHCLAHAGVKLPFELP